jgi:pimeloyl-ACP methyl ester carboxylesterase
MRTVTATFHDGSKIDVEISGSGPAVLLPVNPKPAEGKEAEEKRKWGMDPALGRTFIDGLSDAFTVVAFDYEGHLDEHPQADTLTPENIAHDILAVADAAGAKQFAYYGYSWLAVGALQLAIRTDRLWALIMGGWPPIDGSYKDMLTVTKATYEMTLQPKKPSTKPKTDGEFDWDSVEITRTEPQTRQFMTMYEALQSFDDRAVQSKITCPKLCFAGSNDKIVYSERWDKAVVDIAGPLMRKADELKKYGWDVKVLDGLDHTSAMQPTHVLPVIRPWLVSHAHVKANPAT